MKIQKGKKQIVIIPILFISFCATAVIWLNGGIHPILDSVLPTPDPKSNKLITKRVEAEADIDQDFVALESSMGFTGSETSSYDSCYKGQNNWKVHEGYSNKCEIRLTKFYGSSLDFRQAMLKLHDVLVTHNWESREKDSLPYYMTEYYDTGRSISELPEVYSGYTKAQKTIAITYAEKDVKSLYDLESAQGFSMRGSPTYEDKKFQDMQTVFNKLTEVNNFVVSISITNTYFEN